MILLDTDVLSLLRRPERAPGLRDWIADQPDEGLFLSAVTLGEIARGIALTRARDAAFAADLDRWRRGIVGRYGGRVIAFGATEAEAWGELCARIGHASADLMIAATAQVHGLTVATRNLRHFREAGIPVIDPLAGERG